MSLLKTVSSYIVVPDQTSKPVIKSMIENYCYLSERVVLVCPLQEPAVCHKHLGRLFPGVGRLVHGGDGKIVALVSPQEEVLHLAKVILSTIN